MKTQNILKTAITLAMSSALGMTFLAQAASTGGCANGTSCLNPSQAQVEVLMGKIELFYPSLFVTPSATQTQQLNGSTAIWRSYNNGSTGLASYQGGLWYAINGSWNRFGSLDEANLLFCGSNCWSQSAQSAFTMAQTLSDGAQSTTLAFDGLALMTGNLDAQSFFPPGKVADYTGFQYLRDNDPDNMGHNTDFLTRVANNVILTLTDAQFAQLVTLAGTQVTQVSQYGYQRFPLMQAFRRAMLKDLPSGSTGLNVDAIKAASKALYLIDGQISYDRAILYSNIINSFSSSQKAYFVAMKGKGFKSWPNVTNAQIDSRMKTVPKGMSVAVMTYASDIYAWYAGSLEADVYFCPERHGTYFGSFYMKDAPAVGVPGYSIDEQLTATAGRALIDSSQGYVTDTQATIMNGLTSAQKGNLHDIVTIRTEIATLLRSLRTSGTDVSAVKTKVLSLSGVYGELDGANNALYATTFAKIYQSLTPAQLTKLLSLRKSILSGTYASGSTFDFSTAVHPYLYSDTITDADVAQYVAASDKLFFAP